MRRSNIPSKCLALAGLFVMFLAAHTVVDAQTENDNRVRLIVRLPENAKLVIDETVTKQTGAERRFVSPPLQPGRRYSYTLVATWNEGGKNRSLIRKVAVRAGERLTIDLGGSVAKAPEKKTPPAKTKTKPKVVKKDKPKKDKPKSGKEVAISTTGRGLIRKGPEQPWQLLDKDDPIFPGNQVVAGTDSHIESKDGTVQLALLGDSDGHSPMPIVETSLVFHPSKDVALDFSFITGRVDIINQKKKGVTKVRVRLGEDEGVVDLLEPDTRVALVLYGRWAPGVPFKKDAPPDHAPSGHLMVLVIKGEIHVHTPKRQFLMSAPPGPAFLEGDDVDNTDPTPQRLEKLPDWALETNSEMGKKLKASLIRFRRLAEEKSLGEALDVLIESEDETDRHIAVFAMAATDDLERLGNAITTAKHRDVWDNGILAIRHWIGREPGQDQKLYKRLQGFKGLTPSQAETVMQLLHSFSQAQLEQPATYEALMDLMESDVLPIRGLAHWHLYRLVPAGRKIGYDALHAKEKRDAALKQWRKLIPSGKLPPGS